MTTIELFPADIHNQRTIQQGHPPSWTNRAGGEYDLVVLGGGPAGLVAAMTAAAGGHSVRFCVRLRPSAVRVRIRSRSVMWRPAAAAVGHTSPPVTRARAHAWGHQLGEHVRRGGANRMLTRGRRQRSLTAATRARTQDRARVAHNRGDRPVENPAARDIVPKIGGGVPPLAHVTTLCSKKRQRSSGGPAPSRIPTPLRRSSVRASAGRRTRSNRAAYRGPVCLGYKRTGREVVVTARSPRHYRTHRLSRVRLVTDRQ
jgi:hypothetical protein